MAKDSRTKRIEEKIRKLSPNLRKEVEEFVEGLMEHPARISPFRTRLSIGFNLLGRKDVFDAFDGVVFRESSREVEVRWA